MGALVKVRYEHAFSESPLRSLFESYREESGNRRTPFLYQDFAHSELKKHVRTGGSVFRTVMDMGDPDSSHFAQDVELDGSGLWARQRFERGFE